jgi:hypothetical protein
LGTPALIRALHEGVNPRWFWLKAGDTNQILGLVVFYTEIGFENMRSSTIIHYSTLIPDNFAAYAMRTV